MTTNLSTYKLGEFTEKMQLTKVHTKNKLQSLLLLSSYCLLLICLEFLYPLGLFLVDHMCLETCLFQIYGNINFQNDP
jgi:hypothetical protein